MKNVWLAALSLALMGVIDIQIASPQEAIGQSDLAYEHWVDYRDGEISLAFYKAPVQAALDAIHAQTGLKIVLPSLPEAKLLSLTVNRLPIEPAVRSLISSIGFRNFALLYDEAGRPSAAVVVGTLDDHPSVAANATVAPADRAAVAQPLTPEERSKLEKDIERWGELKKEERGRLEDRLKNLPASEERDQLVKEYGRQVLEIKN